MKKTTPKNNRKGRYIFYGVFFTVGTLIIVLASVLLLNILKSDSLSSSKLCSNLDDFLSLYNEYDSERELPQGLEISSATLTNRGDSITLSVKVKNVSSKLQQLAVNLFFNEETEKLKSEGNPFITYTFDDSCFITAGKEFDFTVTIPVSEKNKDEFIESCSYIYAEIFTLTENGRIIIPLTYKIA